MEDMRSVLGLEPHEKYTGIIERAARAVRALSTSPDADLLALLRRADFVGLATLSGLRAGDAQATVDDVLQRMSPALDALAVPPALQLSPEARAKVARTMEICRPRVAEFN